jgi:hypothetical protein
MNYLINMGLAWCTIFSLHGMFDATYIEKEKQVYNNFGAVLDKTSQVSKIEPSDEAFKLFFGARKIKPPFTFF